MHLKFVVLFGLSCKTAWFGLGKMRKMICGLICSLGGNEIGPKCKQFIFFKPKWHCFISIINKINWATMQTPVPLLQSSRSKIYFTPWRIYHTPTDNNDATTSTEVLTTTQTPSQVSIMPCDSLPSFQTLNNQTLSIQTFHLCCHFSHSLCPSQDLLTAFTRQDLVTCWLQIKTALCSFLFLCFDCNWCSFC